MDRRRLDGLSLRSIWSRWSAVLGVALLTPGTGASLELPYGDGPPPGHTGGFGEPTCVRCHFDHPLDDPATQLQVDGISASYVAGERYHVTLTLRRPGLRRGGFQLAIRSNAPDRAGSQAGTMRRLNDRVQVVLAGNPLVEYAQHSATGSFAEAAETLVWAIEWTAPTEAAGEVVLHVAANAANDDASEFGDYIVVRHLSSLPANSR